MFQKNATGFKSFSHGVIGMRPHGAYRFSSMARGRNSEGCGAIRGFGTSRTPVVVPECISSCRPTNRIDWRIMHPVDFVGNGRLQWDELLGPGGRWLDTQRMSGRAAVLRSERAVLKRQRLGAFETLFLLRY
jgi:hypothetical protein